MTLRISVVMMVIVLVTVFIGLPIFLWIKEDLFISLFGGVLGLSAIPIVAFIANSTILIPSGPTLGVTMPVVSQMAEQNGLILVAGLYAAGSALGEMSGYLAGRKGAEIPFLENSRWRQALKRLLRGKNRTDFALVVLAAFPAILLFDVGGMIAGNIKHPWWRFVLSTFLGRWVKYLVLIQFWSTMEKLPGYEWWILVACLLLVLGIVGWYRKTLMLALVSIKANGIRIERN